MPENQDADRKWSEFADRSNNLADNLGNLFNRATNLIIKYRDGQFMKPDSN
jgi:methionyl-tRNA synthetase